MSIIIPPQPVKMMFFPNLAEAAFSIPIDNEINGKRDKTGFERECIIWHYIWNIHHTTGGLVLYNELINDLVNLRLGCKRTIKNSIEKGNNIWWYLRTGKKLHSDYYRKKYIAIIGFKNLMEQFNVKVIQEAVTTEFYNPRGGKWTLKYLRSFLMELFTINHIITK